MQIHVTPRHLKLTGAIQAYVAEKISHLEHETDKIMAAHVVLWHDETRSPAKAFRVKVHLAIPGPDLYAEEGSSDLYASIDLVMDKLASQIRKLKTKVKDRVRSQAKRYRERQKKRGSS